MSLSANAILPAGSTRTSPPVFMALKSSAWAERIGGITVLERNLRAAVSAGIPRCVLLGARELPERVKKIPGVKWTSEKEAAIAWAGSSPLFLEDDVLYDRKLIRKMLEEPSKAVFSSPLEWRLPVRTKEERRIAEKYIFSGLIKENDGFVSKYFGRHISRWATRCLSHTPVTPNMMTIFCAFLGLWGAWKLGQVDGSSRVMGALLFLSHSILDGTDGELARLKFESSRLGGFLDFWSDNVVHVAVFSAIGTGLWRGGGGIVPLLLGASASIFSLASALMVNRHISKHSGEGPMMSGVIDQKNLDGKTERFIRLQEFAARRDFIVLVLFAALFDKLFWFIGLTAVGSAIYFAGLLYAHRKSLVT